MERIGLFGGTFDPPHLGHSILAAEAKRSLNLDRVLWILTPISPLKNPEQISPFEQRMTLVKTALSEMTEFEFSDVDVSRPVPYYALDTVRIVQAQNPDAELIYLIGGDSLLSLSSWYQPQKLINEVAGFGVLRRPNFELEMGKISQLFPGIENKITFFNAPLIEISGADIRNRIATDRPYRYFLLPSVYRCIEEKSFYRTSNFGY